MTIETLTNEEREALDDSCRDGLEHKCLRIIDQRDALLKERDAEIARLKQEGETMAAINRDQSERLVKTEHQLAYLKRCAQEGPGCDCVDVCKFRPAAPALREHRCDVDTDHCPKCFPAPDPRDAATGESVRLGESCDVCHARTEVRYVCRRHAKELRDAR